jgi:hypothetical protein
MQLTSRQYNQLERAITQRQRIAVFRRGSEFIVVPEKLVLRDSREVIDTVQPSTGDRLSLYLDEIDAFEVVSV